MYGLAIVVVVLDQVTKWMAEQWLVFAQPVPVLPFFNFMLAYNTGAAFSFLADAGGWQRWFFITLALIVSLVLVLWIWRLQADEKWQGLAMALVLGGAIGNVIDRILWGHVIDFIQLYYEQWYWPAFNIADSAITVGVVLLIIDMLWGSGRKRE